jgi:hypothetical protein
MSYDNFHRDAERIFIVRNEIPDGGAFNYSNINNFSPYPLAEYLQTTYPEVDEACNAMMGSRSSKTTMIFEDVEYEVHNLMADSSFMRFFGVRLVAGSMNFVNQESSEVAVTLEQAQKLFGNDDPLGKTLTMFGVERTVGAVVTGWSKHSNVLFDIITANPAFAHWNAQGWQTYIKLKDNIDAKAFAGKLYEAKIEKDGAAYEKIVITPITSLRYEHPLNEVEVKYSYVIIFVVTGALVVICSLFNTLTLYTTRFRIREHEFALRTVFGATKWKIFALLSIEFLMMLAMSFLVALELIQLILPYFRELSNVYLPVSSITVELCVYAAFITMVSLAMYAVLLTLFRRKTLQMSLRKRSGSFSHKTSIAFQLIISIIFIFCSIVMIKQIRFMRNTDLGFDFRNTANILTNSENKMLGDKLREIPEITDIIYGSRPLMPNKIRSSGTLVKEYDGVTVEQDREMRMDVLDISKAKIDFYSLRLLEGEMPAGEHPEAGKVWINEAAARMFGWNKSTGKTIKVHSGINFVVAGVLQDVYNLLPTVPVRPMIAGDVNKLMNYPYVDFSCKNYIVKYREGMWQSCKPKIEAILKEIYPSFPPKIENAEEEYATYVKSETSMITLLSFVSLVCVVISIFGLFSMVSLSCEKRRKEIAIRKINGATILDILEMYIREYSLLLIAGAVVAFPAGYLVMRRWIEQYIKQTEIDAWIYVAVVLLLFATIIACIGRKVYRTSRENPIKAIK